MNTRHTDMRVDSALAPPHWALLQRQLLTAAEEACVAFYQKYFDDQGFLLCVPRWGGDDGPDDAAENLLNWPVLHALGAGDRVLDLYKRGWEGHLRQYTLARTTEVPLALDGMYYREFPTTFDWMHTGEGFSPFFLHGLSDPSDASLIRRTARYTDFYTGEDPAVANYDRDRRLIRSMMNGSRGPLLRKATGLDWAGDPIEVEGRFSPLHQERSYAEMVAHFKDYNDVAGDHPLNLCVTTAAFTAYALTGEERYRRWLLDYVDAWVERTAANDGLIPTNVGLDGTIGGECDGRWWGGVYGWGFQVEVPQTGELAHRPVFSSRAFYGFANALLMTGDSAYLDPWRGMLERVEEHTRQDKGVTTYPQGHDETGWIRFTPERFPGGPETHFWSSDRRDHDFTDQDGWTAYLDGKDPDYPITALEHDLGRIRDRMAEMTADTTTPDTRLSDDMNHINPALTGTLTRLMLGGLPTGRMGSPLYCRLRYFDLESRRAGLPDAVAALVHTMDESSVEVTLVNLDPVRSRRVALQGGAYGEHRLTSLDGAGGRVDVDRQVAAIELEPGCGSRLTIGMQRYANRPTLVLPWDR